ncbi:G-type lectin S-receptor-like serine/threonine-protein kinase LECRK1 [Gossypium raimondii]|uniref:G-type lectin S-receptor-like serine/threonine-protein kinase LECRK1 n=1 Tax=Gossypium raimondii TaxID=29730 RepID=UPI00227C4DAE|nr:G-type lectin S-receptor-like serine/threonine-protein kinase LECRK1 [Gossypium raimondii]
MTDWDASHEVEAQANVTVGKSLAADDTNTTWQSPSGVFAFGFHPITSKKDRFLLAIWYANIPEITIVWYANRDNPETDRGSTVELTETGFLVLNDSKGKELWRHWKLPLSNGLFDREAVDRTALFKVLKSDASGKIPTKSNQSDENQNEVVLILGVLLGTSAIFNFFSLAAISLIFFCLFRRRLGELKGAHSRRDLETNLQFFTYKDLEHATNGFKEELGRGAFGTVYKGELPSSYGDRIAVKKLDKFAQDGEREFKTEVKVIGQTHHKNLVRLIGYCDEAEHRLLVYEFMENGSLSSFLFGILRPSWQQRLQIASGIAKGLTYLHEECSKQIIHCDIKPQNILLDESLTAKISDFGLAKLLMNDKTRTKTGIRGTKGYVAPEWFRKIPVTVKVDVYSFGVMLLEIICCRRCVEVEIEEAAILTDWAFQCYSEGMIEKLVEDDEEARNDVGKLEKLLKVGIWCVQEEPMLRPSMRIVTMMLDGAIQVPDPPCPFSLNSISTSTKMD